MKRGHLSEYFTGVAVKRLSAVEADVFRSHQHEFNGVEALKRLFGDAAGKVQFEAKFIYLCDNDEDPVESNGFLTWYDARERHPTRSEHRLYFPANPAIDCAAEGDVLVLAKRPDNSVLVVVAEKDTTVSNQVQWLFGLNDLTHPGFSIREELETDRDRIALTSRTILESIGVEVETPPDTHLDDMLRMFHGTFPATRAFSAYARNTLPGIDSQDDPDAAVIAWMEREEILFRTLERHLIAKYLAELNKTDIENFLGFSKSIQNRRMSRAGYALENHLEEVFTKFQIRHSRNPTTENSSRPDFIFPGSAEYHDPEFDLGKLTMLGVKSTCKDRWRQILAEADRIKLKYLFTLESAISVNQTNEMRAKGLQLVLPQSLHTTFLPKQREWLLSLEEFIALVLERQSA